MIIPLPKEMERTVDERRKREGEGTKCDYIRVFKSRIPTAEGYWKPVISLEIDAVFIVSPLTRSSRYRDPFDYLCCPEEHPESLPKESTIRPRDFTRDDATSAGRGKRGLLRFSAKFARLDRALLPSDNATAKFAASETRKRADKRMREAALIPGVPPVVCE